MIRTTGRGMTVAGVALGSVSLALGVVGPSSVASAAPVAQPAAVAVSAQHPAATSKEIAAQHAALHAQAAAVAALAGATAIAPPKPKPKPKRKPKKQTPHDMALSLVKARGWSYAQYTCLNKLWTRESDWNPHESNGGSGAYGIPQSLPGRKMASFGRDWRDNPMTQIKWGLWYISDRYGTPCAAWSHSQAHNWY